MATLWNLLSGSEFYLSERQLNTKRGGSKFMESQYDLIIQNALVFDGSGRVPTREDIAVKMAWWQPVEKI